MKTRKLFVKCKNMCLKLETKLSDKEINRRANERGITLQSATDTSVTVECVTLKQYFEANKWF